MSMKPPTTLITGASSGIGLELAHVFASHGENLVLVAREPEKLEKLARTLSKQYGQRVEAIGIDLTRPGAVDDLLKILRSEKLHIETLVNNAGFGEFGPAIETDWKVEANMIELNITVLTRLSKHFAKDMAKRGAGNILNVASTASFYPGVFMSVYYATKAYVLSYSLALAEELAPHVVHVMALSPEPTRTGFAARAHANRTRLFGHPMAARTVAEQAYKGLKRRRRVLVVGSRNKAGVFLSRFIPRRMSARIVREASEKKS